MELTKVTITLDIAYFSLIIFTTLSVVFFTLGISNLKSEKLLRNLFGVVEIAVGSFFGVNTILAILYNFA